MDTSELLRQARRHAGYSQRQLAAVSGMSLRTVVDVECGRRRVSAHGLDVLLAACGLDLVLCPRSELAVPAEVRAHLSLSTTARLHRHCGGVGDVSDVSDDGPALWRELREVARRAVFVLLDGPQAVGVWTPGVPALSRASVGAERRGVALPGSPSHGAPLPATGLVEVRALPQRNAPYRSRTGVHVGVPGGGWVVVPPPAELLLDPRCAASREALRLAARCLHVASGRDAGDRRAPPHRDPDEDREGENLLRSLTYAMDTRQIPEPTDSRGWRVDAPVSLRQWHEANGHPPRAGSRRGG